MNDSRDLSAGSFPPSPWIEIVRGRTSFPCRPVRGDRFLIGAGSQCDLQLGGTDVPILHSLIVVRPEGVTLEAFAKTPDLLVNGEVRRSVTLRHHDRIEIGRVELRFHHPAQSLPADLEADVDPEMEAESPLAEENTPSFTAEEIAELTASEDLADLTIEALVDRLEEERRAAEELSQKRTAGAQALLDAIRRASEEESLEEETPLAEASEAAAAEVESIPMRTLDAEFEERERQLLALEETLAAKAAGLAIVQDRLAEQIDQIREHVRQLETPGESEPLRISA